MHGIVESPFSVPLGAFLVAIVAIVANVVRDSKQNRLRAEQRMAMVGRGMSAQEIDLLLGRSEREKHAVRDPLRGLAIARRAAVVLISSGLGLVLFFALLALIVHQPYVLAGAAVGAIPFAIGIGFTVDYRLQKREMSRFGLEISDEAAEQSRS